MIRNLSAILAGKAILKATQLLNFGGGTAAPGYYALKIDKELLAHFMPQFKKGSIVITGTNGKTTTARVLSYFFKDKKISYIHNRAGSNLERGIVSTCIAAAGFDGNVHNYDYGLWEIDEAEFARSLHKINPKYIVLLNLFRDQLDRYGEVDATKKRWLEALAKIDGNPTIIYNNDDPQLVDLIQQLSAVKTNIQTYGYTVTTNTQDIPHDVLFSPVELTLCPRCRKRLQISRQTVAGQGKFSCSCGFTNADSVLKLRVEGQTETKTTATLCDEKNTLAISSNMTGLFNMYNLAAAIVLTKTLGYTPQQLITATKQYVAAFGRLEKIAVADKKYILTLIKNPTGFTESLKTMQIIEQEYENAWFILNDNFADGKDVSWIWDVDIATYISPQIQKISVSGTRKYDMALRLEYAGVPKEKIHVYETWEEMFAADKNTQTKNTTPVYATYTAMLSLQKYIGDHGIKQTYWSE